MLGTLHHGNGYLACNVVLHVNGMVEISHKLMPKFSPWSQGRRTPSGRQAYNLLSIQAGNGNERCIVLGKSDIAKYQQINKTKECMNS